MKDNLLVSFVALILWCLVSKNSLAFVPLPLTTTITSPSYENRLSKINDPVLWATIERDTLSSSSSSKALGTITTSTATAIEKDDDDDCDEAPEEDNRKTSDNTKPNIKKTVQKCDFCHTTFHSRNALFRHLRADGCTSDNPRAPSDGDLRDPIVKQSIAIQFGYVSTNGSTTTTNVKENKNAGAQAGEGNEDEGRSLNEWAGQRIVHAVQEILLQQQQQQQQQQAEAEGGRREDDNDDDNMQAPILDFQLQDSRTQSSVARLRSRILTQDPDCQAARDVLVLTGSCHQSSLPQLDQVLANNLPSSLENGSIKIWGCKLLWSDLLSSHVSIHAERSCTQMVYHHLVPLSWLPDGDLLQNQWKGWKEKPPTDSLRRFKAALRCAESAMVSGDYNTNDDTSSSSSSSTTSSIKKVAAGRFGRLGAKERRAWHNFADPILRGKASPNQEPVWRVVDICRMVGMVNFGKDDASLLVEVKGDAFVPQQIRRIVGTALAIAHGWLPSYSNTTTNTKDGNIWDTALLNPEYVMETVLAPPGRLYLADCRFHFEESRTSGTPLFESDICGKVLARADESKKATTWAAKEMLKRLSNDESRQAEQQWLDDVRDTVAPRIRDSLRWLNPSSSTSTDQAHNTGSSLSPTPTEYEKVLENLRQIVANRRWPDTSVARSSVIRRSSSHVEQTQNTGKAGSFTVVNPKVLDKLQREGQETIEMPLGNQLFPDLVQAVFELEEAISDQARKAEVTPATGRVEVSMDCTTRRPQSSHCAINAQAQFTPHVDSGRGAGQSLSIIVGLGDYWQGELMVEGLPCNIRFQPLEFNGWALRHWTNRYQGERFSLVWFTPEPKA